MKIHPIMIILGLCLKVQALYCSEVREFMKSFGIENVDFLADTIRIFNKSAHFDYHCVTHFSGSGQTYHYQPINVLKNEEKWVQVPKKCSPASVIAYNIINFNNGAFIDGNAGMKFGLNSNAYIIVLFTDWINQIETGCALSIDN